MSQEADILNRAYEDAATRDEPARRGQCDPLCDVIVDKSENAHGAVAVLVTLLVKKISDHNQDIRNHRLELPGGFSGRGLDTRVVTPFIKSHQLTSRASSSGWLTRAFEQPFPYTLDYPANISPRVVKDAFLGIIDAVENGRSDAFDVLSRILAGLIEKRERNTSIALARPVNLTVSDTVSKIEQHFVSGAVGASRLPVLAIYALLKVVVDETERYNNCAVMPLASHTSADAGSGLIGDVHIKDENNRICEGIEVKHEIPITEGLINDAYEKFRNLPINRYCILTTHSSGLSHGLHDKIDEVHRQHGCQVIVNGVIPTLRYGLRVVTSTSRFVDEYVSAVETDAVVSYELKQSWNQIVGLA